MLPGDPTTATRNGQIAAGTLGQLDGPVSLVGLPNGAGEYKDLFTISLLGHAVKLDSPSAITLTNGPASIVEDGGGWVTIVQQRGEQWVLVSGFIDRSVAINAMQQSTVGADGSLAIQSEQFEILTTESTVNGDLVTALFNTNDGLTVETSTATTPMLNNLGPVSAASRLTVRGNPGWQLTTSGPDASEQHIISWMETPDRSAMVYGTASVDTLLALANSLEVVDYPTWLIAVGGPSTTDPNHAERARLNQEALARLAEATQAAEEAAAKAAAESTP
jgi:hypothetical protein